MYFVSIAAFGRVFCESGPKFEESNRRKFRELWNRIIGEVRRKIALGLNFSQ